MQSTEISVDELCAFALSCMMEEQRSLPIKKIEIFAFYSGNEKRIFTKEDEYGWRVLCLRQAGLLGN